MKKVLFLVSAAVVGLSASAAWTYDATEGTISDGVWKFGATVKNGTTELTVNAVQVVPGEVSPLDFSQPVTDSDGASYAIVKLNPQFATAACGQRSNTPYLDITPHDGYDKVGSLVLPETGLTEISASAFAGCVNLEGTLTLPDGLKTIGSCAFARCTGITKVVNYVPDTVTTLGEGAFIEVPAGGELRLWSVGTITALTGWKSGIESIYFGPALKSMSNAHWAASPFRECTSLVSITFDPGITGAAWTGQSVFSGSGNITNEVLDLSGFKSIDAGWGIFSGSKVEKIIFGTGIATLNGESLKGFAELKEVWFAGKPPKSFTNIYTGQSATKVIRTYVQLDYIEDWKPLAQDNVINDYGSTFSTAYVAANLQPCRLLLCKEAGGGGGDLGDAVVKDGILTMPNGWKFNALLKGASLFVESCVGVPDEPSPLDFSVRITDDLGHDLVVNTIDTQFAQVSYSTDGKNVVIYELTPALVDGQPAGEKLTAVTFPTNGVYEIGAGAFAGCTALTEVSLPTNLVIINTGAFASCTNLRKIENYIPDSVTTLGGAAFVEVPANQDLRLYSIKSVSDLAFWKSGIGSVYFGPVLGNLWGGHWTRGPFKDCSNLTNILFDARISGATWGSNSTFAGDKLTAIVGTFDLSGFTTLDGSWGLLDAPNVGEIILAGGMTKLNAAGSFQSLSGLTNIVFKGVPPKTLSTPYLSGSSGTKVIATHVPRKSIAVKNDSGKCWLDYSADGAIQHKGTTWAQTHLVSGVDPTFRPLLTVEPDGLMLIVK